MIAGPAPRVFRAIGWLLTPLVVWAASFFGAWLGATLGRRFPLFLGGIEWMLLGGVLGGATALALWVHRLRRGRRLWQEAKTPALRSPSPARDRGPGGEAGGEDSRPPT